MEYEIRISFNFIPKTFRVILNDLACKPNLALALGLPLYYSLHVGHSRLSITCPRVWYLAS